MNPRALRNSATKHPARNAEAAVQKLFSQVRPSAYPLDLGDDCAEMLRATWDARKNRSQAFTQLDIDRLCAGFRTIGKSK